MHVTIRHVLPHRRQILNYGQASLWDYYLLQVIQAVTWNYSPSLLNGQQNCQAFERRFSYPKIRPLYFLQGKKRGNVKGALNSLLKLLNMDL